MNTPSSTVTKACQISVTVIAIAVTLAACTSQGATYTTFADHPGFEQYYPRRCSGRSPLSAVGAHDKELLRRHRPRLVLPPGGHSPIDFYRDYVPHTVMRRYPERSIVTEKVTPEVLRSNMNNTSVYLDLQLDRFRAAALGRPWRGTKEESSERQNKPAVYGRVYRETVTFPSSAGGHVSRSLTFLKYNVVFATSGLPARLPLGFETLLRLAGIDLEDWHELDNFVAIHVVLDEVHTPIAVILAQHNHHRTYLIGKDISLPADGRIAFDIALRSNEVYPASNYTGPVKHRVIPWSAYMKYLLSGKDPPFFRGYDVTYGLRAGGKEIPYDLAVLSPCDPFYTATMMLGELRPFLRLNIGRDGPPGADYYALPSLVPLGNLLKFSYLHDGDPDDISMIDGAIDRETREIDVGRIMEYGGRRFYEDLAAARTSCS